MNWQAVHKLLDALDITANSNSFFLELGIPKHKSSVEEILLIHLESGNFHFELAKQDIQRGWYHFSEEVFLKNPEQKSIIIRPGNSWNGNRKFIATDITSENFSELLLDLLLNHDCTNKGRHSNFFAFFII